MECKFCGKVLVKKPWEIRQRVKISRGYCDRHCAAKKDGVDPIKTRYRVLKINRRRIAEHRWIMEQSIGRKLESWEYVHHIDQDKLNNDISNLKIVSPKLHGLEHTFHPKEKKCLICQAIFVPHKTKRAIKKTCSKICRYKLNREAMLNKRRKHSKS